jgi:hypothetical protein
MSKRLWCNSASARSNGSRRRLEPHTHPIRPSPHDDAMPGVVVKVQVELYRQVEGSLKPKCSPGRRKVSNSAIYSHPFRKGDLADHQNLVSRNESAFGALIWGSEPQRPPRWVPISRKRRRRQHRKPRPGFIVEVKSPDEKPGLSISPGGQYALRVRNGRCACTAGAAARV